MSRLPSQENMFYTDGEHAVMVQQHTRVNVGREMPKDHFIWSLICCIYYNPFCLGLAALICSVKARDRKILCDVKGARTALNVISTLIFCLSVLITVLVVTFLVSQIILNVLSLGQKL